MMNEKIGSCKINKYNEEAYIYYYNCQLKTNIIINVICFFAAIVVSYIYIILGDRSNLILIPTSIVWLVLIITTIISIKNKKEKTIADFKYQNNSKIEIDFYDDFLQIQSSNDSGENITKHNYAEYKKIIVTDKYFILYNKQSVLPLLKEDIESDNLDLLINKIKVAFSEHKKTN